MGRVPRWALAATAVTLVAILGEVAFVVVQSSGDGGAPTVQEEPLPCNKRAARNVVGADRFARGVRDLGTVPPLAKVLEIYDLALIGCADLTGDGIDEMVVQLTEIGAPPAAPTETTPGATTETTPGATTETTPDATTETTPDATTETTPDVTSGATTGFTTDSPQPWAIYEAQEGKWTPVLLRTHVPGARVRLEQDRVKEMSAALAEGDPLCCPTGAREGVVRWSGEAFTYRPLGGPRGRTIALADGEPVALGGFDLRGGSLTEASEFFGPPSTYAPERKVCPAGWDDLGLTIELASLGGLDPCGPDGRVAGATVQGVEAATAGWKTQQGATVEMSEDELRGLYPKMEPVEEVKTVVPDQPDGTLFTLVGGPSEVGADQLTPALSARVNEGRVVGFEISVGAAGE